MLSYMHISSGLTELRSSYAPPWSSKLMTESDSAESDSPVYLAESDLSESDPEMEAILNPGKEYHQCWYQGVKIPQQERNLHLSSESEFESRYKVYQVTTQEERKLDSNSDIDIAKTTSSENSVIILPDNLESDSESDFDSESRSRKNVLQDPRDKKRRKLDYNNDLQDTRSISSESNF